MSVHYQCSKDNILGILAQINSLEADGYLEVKVRVEELERWDDHLRSTILEYFHLLCAPGIDLTH